MFSQWGKKYNALIRNLFQVIMADIADCYTVIGYGYLYIIMFHNCILPLALVLAF